MVNKPTDNEFYKDFVLKNGEKILGEIPFDENIMNYDFAGVKIETKEAMRSVVEKVKQLRKRGNLSTIKDFQDIKKGLPDI